MSSKQTSAKISGLAARYLATDDIGFWTIVQDATDTDWTQEGVVKLEQMFKDIRCMAASLLSQDQTKGQGK